MRHGDRSTPTSYIDVRLAVLDDYDEACNRGGPGAVVAAHGWIFSMLLARWEAQRL